MTSNRLETGRTCCDGDWPGLFIRGDSCFSYVLSIADAIEFLKSNVEWENQTDYTMFNTLSSLQELKKLLESTNVQSECKTINSLKSFEECSR